MSGIKTDDLHPSDFPRKKPQPEIPTFYCSFCSKSQHEVRKIVAGPTVFICNECVELCMDIVIEGTPDEKFELPKSYQTLFGVMIPKRILGDTSFDMIAIMATIQAPQTQSPSDFALEVGHAIIKARRQEILAFVNKNIATIQSTLEETNLRLCAIPSFAGDKEPELILKALHIAQASEQLDPVEQNGIKRTMRQVSEIVTLYKKVENLRQTMLTLNEYRTFVSELV